MSAHPNTAPKLLAANVRDLLHFVVMALITGIACGGALILLVMLFSTTAQAQVIANHDVSRGELLLASDDGSRVAAPLLSTHVDAQLSGLIARVKVVQTFQNPAPLVREAIYAFPLPENAAVDHMDVMIGERHIQGQIKERQQARQIYETAKREGRKAALVEQWRPNLFTTSVAPIDAYERIVVTIEYQQTLRYDQGTLSWRFPLAITPRYTPPSAGDAGVPFMLDDEHGEREEDPMTASASPTPKATPTALSAQPLLDMPLAMDGQMHTPDKKNAVSFEITLAPGAPITEVLSSYHDIALATIDQDRYRVTLKDGTVAADHDFEISWTPKTGSAPTSALYSETFEGENYYYLMMLPHHADTNSDRVAREVTLIIDTSGSMAGESIRQAKQALQLAIHRLQPRDYFNVIEFNHKMQSLFPQPVAANEKNLRQAESFVSALNASGGTEMYPALQAALTAPKTPGLIGQVIFLTDGAVGNEEQLFALVRQSLGERRLFTVGIGSAPNGYFMTRAAEFGRGTFTYIGNMNEVQQKSEALFRKLETPALTNIEAKWSSSAEMYPATIGDLYFGEPVVAVARMNAHGDLLISGARGTDGWHSSLAFDQAIPASGVATLWARRKMDALIDHGQQRGGEESIRAEATALALKHHLVSRFTSLVAVDVTPTLLPDSIEEKSAVPNTLPHGMSHSMAGMASTATPAIWHALLGILLLLTALSLYRRNCVAR